MNLLLSASLSGKHCGGWGRYPGRCPGLKRLKAFQAFGTSKFACVTGFYGVTKFDGVTVFDCVTDFDGVTVSTIVRFTFREALWGAFVTQGGALG